MENAETPQHVTDPTRIENIKATIYTIEGLFHAVNAASFPLSWHDAVKRGMNFMNGMHTQLLTQLPPEVVAAIRANPNEQAPAQAPATASEAPQTNESPIQVVN
jgi:hypothetical protein